MFRDHIFGTGDRTVIWLYMIILGVIGSIANAIILFLFFSTKSLRTPMNTLFISLTFGDFAVCLFGTFPTGLLTIAKANLDQVSCNLIGFIVFFGGVADGIALTVIAVERYITIAKPFGIGAMTFKRAYMWMGFTWFMALIAAGLPLVGLSKYTHEGAGTWCGIDWEVKNLVTDIYIIYIFITSYFLPIVIIVFCYYVVAAKVREVAKTGASESSLKAEKAVTRQAIAMVIAFLVAWSPYAFFCMYSTIAPNNPFGPKVTATPSMFAKASFVYNPFIYVGLNKQFRAAFVEKVLRGYDPFAKKKVEEDVKTEAITNNYKATIGQSTTVAQGVDNKGADVPTISANVGGPSTLQVVTGEASKVSPES